MNTATPPRNRSNRPGGAPGRPGGAPGRPGGPGGRPTGPGEGGGGPGRGRRGPRDGEGRPGRDGGRDERGDWQERIIEVNRVTKVVKGGKNMSFRALVVIGDGKGTIGVGIGKAAEVVEAVRKSIEDAKKNTVKVPFDQGSIPHNVLGRSNSSRVHLFRARKGTGLIAALMVKAAFELAGLHNVVCKIQGSTNPTNVLLAMIDAIRKLKTRNQIKQLRQGTLLNNRKKSATGDEEQSSALEPELVEQDNPVEATSATDAE